MATPAHCLYCFEVLSAAFTDYEPPSLAEVEALWQDYTSETDGKPAGHDATMSEAEDEEEQEDEDEDEDATEPGALENKEHNGRSTHSLSQALAQKRSGGVDIGQRAAMHPTSSLLNAPSLTSNSSPNSSRTPSVQSRSSGSSNSTESTQPSREASETNLAATGEAPLGPSPMFVTWNTTTRSGDTNLRGCIGTFDAMPLQKGLATYATTSAFEDTRFAPISYHELPSLSCAITLLMNFETAPAPLGWTIGVHGIRISFTDKGRKYNATYLPNVAQEQGWTKVETMVSLMRKAGWKGRKEEWQRVGDLKVVRYQGKKVSVEWEEWRDWRAWAEDVSDL